MPVTRVRSKNQFEVNDHVSFNDQYRITGLVDPVGAQDAATKAYVDATKQGLDIKDSVRVATTGSNITLSGTQNIDGIALVAGNRVLVKDQTNAYDNGIYIVQSGAWIRAEDANSNTEISSGMYTYVEEGTANGRSSFVLVTTGTITLGTTPLTFVQFSKAGDITDGDGLYKAGSTLHIGTASVARIVVNADNIDLATTSVVAGTYGNSGYNVAQVTFDAYGRATGASNRDIFGSSNAANTVFAAPNGSAGAPSFRALVAADIPSLDAGKVNSGTFGIARGGTGISTTPTNGQLLIGNGSGYTLTTLTQGTGITITNAAGSITIANAGVTGLTGTANQVSVSASTGSVTLSLPQNIHTSATPTFQGLTLNGGTVAANTPALNIAQTWNAGAVSFNGVVLNITDTASAAGSEFIDLQVGGVTKFSIRKDGAIVNGSWLAGTIAADRGGTGQSSYTVGDILYASSATALSKLAAAATGNALISGGVGAAPSWGKIGLSSHVSGTLPTGNGGTGVTGTPTNGQLLVGNGAGYTLSTITGGTGITVTNGSGSISIAVAADVALVSKRVVRESPSGLVDGSNATFTLGNTPVAGSEEVFVNGILQDIGAGNDYTISGTTITFQSGAIPLAGDKIRVSYQKL